MSAPDVAVLGAGPAGLACAWELASRGARVVVLEASAHVGGLAATTERDGFRFDQGGHRFLTRWPELLERVTKLMGDELLRVDRHSVVVSEGRRFGYPLELADLLRNVPLRRGLHYLASWAGERLRRPARDESTFEGWMVRRFGPALYAEFFAPYSRKLWGIEPSRLSSDWAPQRIGSFDLGFALRDLFGLARTRPRTVARRFLYPRLGMGQLFDAIAHEVERLGGSIRTEARIVGLALEGGRVRAARTAAGELEARAFVSTLPLPELARLLGAHAHLRFRGLRFLNLMLDAPAQLGSTWAYLSDGAGLVSRVQEPARRSPFMVPPGRGSLQLELPGSPGEPGFELDDDALFARAWPEVARAGLVIPAGVSGFFSSRAPYAYPLFDRATAAELTRARASASRFTNLALAGRQGRFSYVFADRAMEEGIAAARRILGVSEGLPDPSCETPCLTEAQSLVG
ncbi:MAG: FAD-dependent oxidoreductase [Myxococcota bacterium]